MQAEIRKGMILAAGEGTRLRPLTLGTPKAMVPVGGVPLIAHTVSWLVSHGVSEIVVNLHYLGERIVALLGDGSALGARITYSWENELLGTAGGVRRCAEFFDGPFVVVYGDVLTNYDLTELITFHRKRQSVATLALYRVPSPWEAGIVQTDKDGRVTRFVEKPPRGSDAGNLANSGLYILEQGVFAYIEPDTFSDFGFHVLPRLIAEGLPVWGCPVPDDTYLLDIGNTEKYRRANLDATSGAVRLPLLSAAGWAYGEPPASFDSAPHRQSHARGDDPC